MTSDVVWISGAADDYRKVDDRLLPASSIDGIVQLVRLFPEMGSPESNRVRRVLVGKERTFGLYYASEGDRIIVLALIDLRQDPLSIEAVLQSRGIRS